MMVWSDSKVLLFFQALFLFRKPDFLSTVTDPQVRSAFESSSPSEKESLESLKGKPDFRTLKWSFARNGQHTNHIAFTLMTGSQSCWQVLYVLLKMLTMQSLFGGTWLLNTKGQVLFLECYSISTCRKLNKKIYGNTIQ